MFDDGYLILSCCAVLVGLIAMTIIAIRNDNKNFKAMKNKKAKTVPKTTKKETTVSSYNRDQFEVDAIFSVTGNPYVEGTVRFEAWERARR